MQAQAIAPAEVIGKGRAVVPAVRRRVGEYRYLRPVRVVRSAVAVATLARPVVVYVIGRNRAESGVRERLVNLVACWHTEKRKGRSPVRSGPS